MNDKCQMEEGAEETTWEEAQEAMSEAHTWDFTKKPASSPMREWWKPMPNYRYGALNDAEVDTSLFHGGGILNQQHDYIEVVFSAASNDAAEAVAKLWEDAGINGPDDAKRKVLFFDQQYPAFYSVNGSKKEAT